MDWFRCLFSRHVQKVISDCLQGQLGGMLYAAIFGSRFDSDPKRFRMIAAYFLDAATALEMLTPLFPKFFLPFAAIANAGNLTLDQTCV